MEDIYRAGGDIRSLRSYKELKEFYGAGGDIRSWMCFKEMEEL